jgi:hypothetical protein
LVSAAVLGRLAGLGFGVDILITRDIAWLLPDALARLPISGTNVVLAESCRSCGVPTIW